MKKATKSGPLTNTKDGIISALKNDDGAIPNEALAAPAKGKQKHSPLLEKLSGRVVQSRPPVQGFHCDTCGFDSWGWQDMTKHVDETGHLNYTAKGVT